MQFKTIIYLFILVFLISCGNSKLLPVSSFYEYDKKLPLQDSVKLIKETADYKLFYVTFQSVQNKKVTGLLTIPAGHENPLPVIILLHGKGDRKTVDYIEYGNELLYKNGFAVLRIDIINHGDRIENSY
ncbi:MAG: hypothetical protein HOA90_08940, partial [Prolixibacteraceae bacterium]|nr:hypothetical protein [Prolixibacteraceae bacterium]